MLTLSCARTVVVLRFGDVVAMVLGVVIFGAYGLVVLRMRWTERKERRKR